MKKERYYIYSLIFLYILTLLLFSFFLYKTRISPQILINIQKSDLTSSDSILLSKHQMENLEKNLNNLNDINSIPNLIQVFEREREHYILLTALLFGLATIISGIFAISRFVEKSEYIRINEEILKLEEKLEKELRLLRINNIKTFIQQRTNMINEDASFLLKGVPISNKDSLILFIEHQVSSIAHNLKNENPPITDDLIYINHNYILAWLKYAQRRKFENEIDFDVENNKIFYTIIKELSEGLGETVFNNLIKKTKGIDVLNYNLGIFNP